MDLSGIRMITTNNGTSSVTNGSAGVGGVIWISNLLSLKPGYKAVNGNNGKGTGVSYSQPGGLTTSTYKWGEGYWLSTSSSIQAGGFILIYKSLK